MGMWTWEQWQLDGWNAGSSQDSVQSGELHGHSLLPTDVAPHHAGGSGFGPTGDSAIAAEKQIHRLVAEPVRENILELDASRFENSLF